MRFGALVAAALVAISGVGMGSAAKAAYSYTLSACDSFSCTTPTSTILSFTIDTLITTPPTAPESFSSYMPVAGAVATEGSFTALSTLSYNVTLPGTTTARQGSYLRVDGLVSADGSNVYVRNGFPTLFSTRNASATDLPLVLDVGTYSEMGASPCLNADCSASVGVIQPTLLTVKLIGDVPELASWELMLAGFGAIGAMVRRDRRGPTFA